MVINPPVPTKAPAHTGSYQPHWNWKHTICIVEEQAAPLGSHPGPAMTADGVRQQTSGEQAANTAQQPQMAHQARHHSSAADAEAMDGSAPHAGLTDISACQLSVSAAPAGLPPQQFGAGVTGGDAQPSTAAEHEGMTSEPTAAVEGAAGREQGPLLKSWLKSEARRKFGTGAVGRPVEVYSPRSKAFRAGLLIAFRSTGDHLVQYEVWLLSFLVPALGRSTGRL